MTYLNDTLKSLIEKVTEIIIDKTYSLKFQPGMGIGAIQAEYMVTLEDIMLSYLESTRPITAYRNEFRRAANEAMILAANAGWVDGGASGPIPDELSNWVVGRIDQEVDFIIGVFDGLRDLRKEGTGEDQQSFVSARVEGYTGTIEGVYNYAMMYAQKMRPGMWQLGRTERHCSTCATLHGQVHPLQWFLDNNYIPRQPGNPNLECGGWHCDCRIVDPNTGEQII